LRVPKKYLCFVLRYFKLRIIVFLVSPHVKVKMAAIPLVAGSGEASAAQCIANNGGFLFIEI